MDFSFNNKDIKKYFDGDDSCAPIREVIYLDTHPLIRPNFLLEVNSLVVSAGEKLMAAKANVNSKPVKELERLCINLGTNLPKDEASAEIFLKHLRDLYNLCNSILRNK